VVATGFNDLALLYQREGQYIEAEPLLKRALEIRERTLGPEHADVAATLEDYAMLLRETGRAAEAEVYAARAKAIRAMDGAETR
jgi:tetratricopeptide (TPR) repeat protein